MREKDRPEDHSRTRWVSCGRKPPEYGPCHRESGHAGPCAHDYRQPDQTTLDRERTRIAIWLRAHPGLIDAVELADALENNGELW